MVLVVEDDLAIRESMRAVLEDAGFEVQTAPNGRLALHYMFERAPSLVLLDLMMPEMDGWQLVSQMQKDPRLAQVPICVISATGSQTPKRVSLMKKPVGLADLVAMVNSCCNHVV